MAIEPLGSIMTIQNQSIQKVERPVEASMEASTQTKDHAVVDGSTLTVTEVQQKSDGASTEGGSNQQQYTGDGAASHEQIKQAIEKMNKQMYGSEAVFGIHEGTNRVTIKIVDKDTKAVIKELPAEKTLDMIQRVWEMAGILVDEKR